MLDRVISVAAVVAITGLGNWLLRRRLSALRARKERAIEFHKRLGEYFESRGQNSEAYTWLTHRANRIQREMGTHGILAQYRPPFANFMYPNWPIVLNALPEIQRGIGDPILNAQAGGYAQILKDALVRYVGALDDDIEEGQAELVNPISSFREGIRTILRVPFYALHWLGLRTAPSLMSGAVGRITTGIVALISLASAIVSLIVGWPAFTEMLGSLFRR